MIRYLILFIIVMFFSGCGPRINLSTSDILENDYVSFSAPSNSWQGFKKGKDFDYKDVIYLMSRPIGTTYDIDIYTEAYGNWRGILFDKNGDVEKERERERTNPFNIKRDKEQGITYKKKQIQYVKGLKCRAIVYSRNFGGSYYNGTSKNYIINCGYYDKTIKKGDGKRMVRIGYRYIYGGTTKENKNKPNRLEVENNLKDAVKKLISTLKIKNFDKEKMIKEGLYHPNKKYEHMKW